MKKLISFTLTFIMVLSLSVSVCAGDLPALKIGITQYHPFNYYDEEGLFTGFDTNLAEKVCEKLGYEAEFIEINWDEKYLDLLSGNIHCIWNALTLTEEVTEYASVTDPYAFTSIVLVADKESAASFTDFESLNGKKIAIEIFSPIGDLLIDAGYEVVQFPSANEALVAVNEGTCDCAAIESRFFTESDFSNLEMVFALSKDEYVVACKKDSPLTAKIDNAMKELYQDGTVEKLNQKYSLGLFDEIPEKIISKPSEKEEPIKIVVDNNLLEFDTAPIITNSRTMVPMRAIFEALGATVSWNQESKTAMAVKDDTTIHIIIGNSHMAVNERIIELDSPAILHNDRTLVPVRAISEALGCFVEWDNTARTVYIYNEVFPQQKEIVVENVLDLIQSIGSNRKIILKEGKYNLSDLNAPFFYNMNISEQGVITNVFNMTIEGNAEILTDDIYDDVLSFENCKKITLDGLTVGHNTYFDEYMCEGAVTRFRGCSDIEIKNCNLYGCGAVGVSAINTFNVQVYNTKIYDCSYTGIWLSDSIAIVTNSEIYDLKPFSGFIRCDNSRIYIKDSSIHDIDCGEEGEFIETFDYNGVRSKIEINSCNFKNNKFKELSHTEDIDVTFNNCTFDEN